MAIALPDCHVSGIAAGLHLLLSLPEGVDPALAVSETAARGVRVANLDHYLVRGTGKALVVGYGNLSDHNVDEAVGQLAAAVRASSQSARCLQ